MKKISTLFSKKTSFLLWSLAAIFVGVSCQEDSSQVTEFDQTFPSTKEITSVPIDEITQLNPSRICVLDSIVVVSDWRESPRMHFYKKEDFSLVATLGKIGEGPNEYHNPEFICQVLQNEEGEDYIMVYEFSNGIIYDVSLDSILQNKNGILRKSTMNHRLTGSDNIFRVGDSIYGEVLLNGEMKYFSMLADDFDTFKPKGEMNESDFLQRVDPVDRSNMERSFMAYNQDRGKFITSYYHFNQIRILDINLNTEKVIHYGNSYQEPTSTDVFGGENIRYFLNRPYAGKDSFFVLYSGLSQNEEDAGKERYEIHEFDYEGNPLSRYIPDLPLEGFTIDEEENLIYAITMDEDKPVVKYPLE